MQTDSQNNNQNHTVDQKTNINTTTSSHQNNVYQAPQSTIQINDDHEVNNSTWYHKSGRIGRLRYTCYQLFIYIFLTFVAGMVVGVLAAILVPMVGDSASIIIGLLYILFIIPWFIYAGVIYPVRRLHDLNQSGWLALISFIPLINLIFSFYLMFAPGTQGSNNYGAPPRENQWYHWIAAIVAPIGLIALFGILAAVAIPAYEDYVERAQQAQIENQPMHDVNADPVEYFENNLSSE